MTLHEQFKTTQAQQAQNRTTNTKDFQRKYERGVVYERATTRRAWAMALGIIAIPLVLWIVLTRIGADHKARVLQANLLANQPTVTPDTRIQLTEAFLIPTLAPGDTPLEHWQETRAQFLGLVVPTASPIAAVLPSSVVATRKPFNYAEDIIIPPPDKLPQVRATLTAIRAARKATPARP